MSGEKVITAVINDKWSLDKLRSLSFDKFYPGAAQPVVHNNVRLNFNLCFRRGANDLKSLVSIRYADGPKEEIKVSYYVNVVNGQGKDPFRDKTKFCTPDTVLKRGRPKSTISVPVPAVHLLAKQNYLSYGNTFLHVMAVLRIPESAFVDPELKCQVSTAVPNPFLASLYSQINTPVDTSSAHNFGRFDFISSDGQHFYVHKDILSFSSDVFKQMFDPEKQEQAQFKYIKEGFMKMETLEAGTLNEMFSYIYLGHTTPDFGQFAQKVIQAADMYGLPGLMSLCERKLIEKTKNMKDITLLLDYLHIGCTHNLDNLARTCAQASRIAIVETKNMSRELLVRAIALATEHKYRELSLPCEMKLLKQVQLLGDDEPTDKVLDFVSIATKYDLTNLMGACAGWFGKNWAKLMENGLPALTDQDKTGVLPLVLGHALSFCSSNSSFKANST